MAWKEVASGATRYPKYAECSAGDTIVEGKYLGNYEGQYGKQYKFQDNDGEVVLGKAGQLDYLMAMVPEGSACKVVYDGAEVMKKGAYAGKTAHRFKVLVDDAGEPEELF